MTRVLAELSGPDELVAAIARLRAAGYTRLEAYVPYPVHEVEAALDRPASRLPLAVAVAGLGGAGAAYALQWLLNAYLYPLDVGHRPPHYPLSYVPITFEMGVLAAAITAFAAVLVLGGLVRLWQPVFDAEGFESASRDGFWLEVHGADPHFDAARVVALLHELGGRRVQEVRA